MSKPYNYEPIFSCFKNKSVGDTLLLGSVAAGLSTVGAVATVTGTDDETFWSFTLTWYGLVLGAYTLTKSKKNIELVECAA